MGLYPQLVESAKRRYLSDPEFHEKVERAVSEAVSDVAYARGMAGRSNWIPPDEQSFATLAVSIALIMEEDREGHS